MPWISPSLLHTYYQYLRFYLKKRKDLARVNVSVFSKHHVLRSHAFYLNPNPQTHSMNPVPTDAPKELLAGEVAIDFFLHSSIQVGGKTLSRFMVWIQRISNHPFLSFKPCKLSKSCIHFCLIFMKEAHLEGAIEEIASFNRKALCFF